MQATCWTHSATYPFAQQILHGNITCGVIGPVVSFVCAFGLQALIESRALLVSTDQLFQVGLTTWCFKPWLLQQENIGKTTTSRAPLFTWFLHLRPLHLLKRNWGRKIVETVPAHLATGVSRLCKRVGQHGGLCTLLRRRAQQVSKHLQGSDSAWIRSINLGLPYFARS